MSGEKAKALKVGAVVEVSDPAEVTRPDGSVVTVTGGLFVVSKPGTYVLGGTETEAK